MLLEQRFELGRIGLLGCLEGLVVGSYFSHDPTL
jgi:hypothetical protein